MGKIAGAQVGGRCVELDFQKRGAEERGKRGGY
jgi:hypothetical protein